MKSKKVVSSNSLGITIGERQMSTFRPEYFDMFDSSILLERDLVLLLQSENRWFTTEEINQALRVKSNTTLRIVNRLEEDLLEMEEDNLELVVSKGKGFFLQKNLDSSVTPFISYIFSKTQIIKMIEAIFSGEFGTVKKYAQDYYISEATVRRYLIRIRKFFSRYEIQVKRETAELEGSESQIRMIMLLTYWRLYNGVKWPFTTINEQSIMKLVEEVTSEIDHMNVSLIMKRRLAYYFAVTILRTRKGNFVEIEFQNYSHLLEDNHYRYFEKYLMDYKGDINTSYGEIPFHYMVWKTHPSFYKNKEFIQSYYYLEKEKQTPVFKAVELMVKQFQQEFSEIPEKKYQEFYGTAYACHEFAYQFKGFSTDLGGYFYNSVIERDYPNLGEKIEIFLNKLYQLSGNSIFLETEYLKLMYCLLFSQIKPISSLEKQINIYLETDLPMPVTLLLKNQIETYFSLRHHLKVWADLTEIPENIDIVLTTVPFSDIKKFFPHAETITVSRNIGINDFKNIREEIVGLIKKESAQTSEVFTRG